MSGCGDFYGDKFDVFEFTIFLFIVSSETRAAAANHVGCMFMLHYSHASDMFQHMFIQHRT